MVFRGLNGHGAIKEEHVVQYETARDAVLSARYDTGYIGTECPASVAYRVSAYIYITVVYR